MLEAAKRSEFDCWFSGRWIWLTREGALATLQYLEVLAKHNVGFRSYCESYIDSCGPLGEAVIAILAAMAAQERIGSPNAP